MGNRIISYFVEMELPYRVVEKSCKVWNFAAETKKTIIQ